MRQLFFGVGRGEQLEHLVLLAIHVREVSRDQSVEGGDEGGDQRVAVGGAGLVQPGGALEHLAVEQLHARVLAVQRLGERAILRGHHRQHLHVFVVRVLAEEADYPADRLERAGRFRRIRELGPRDEPRGEEQLIAQGAVDDVEGVRFHARQDAPSLESGLLNGCCGLLEKILENLKKTLSGLHDPSRAP